MNSFRPEIDLWSFLSTLDLSVMLVFLVLFVLSPQIIKRFTKQKASSEDYLLMNRGLGLPLFVATLTSTWYGGIFGVTQIAFEHGLYSFFTQGISWYSAYLIFALVLAKKIRALKVASLPELLGLRFGAKARKLSGLILFFHALPVSYAVSLGIILQIITGLSFPLSVAIGVSIVASYSITGGLRAIVVTDGVQFLLMFASVIMIALYSIHSFGGWSFLTESLPSSYFLWQGNSSGLALLVWFLVACSSTLIHPVFYQRCLAAKNDQTAIRGILIAIGLWMLFDCCTTLGGMYAKALIPDAPSDKAYLYYGIQLMPAGLRGLFITGIIATILSTLDSFLFVSGTSVSYDFLSNKKNNIAQHQFMIGISAIFVISIAILFKANFESMWLFMEGVFSTSLFLPVMAALFIKIPLAPRIFLVPAISSFFIYSCATFLSLSTEFFSLSPFFLAHGASFLTFFSLLYSHAKSHAKMSELSY